MDSVLVTGRWECLHWGLAQVLHLWLKLEKQVVKRTWQVRALLLAKSLVMALLV